MKLNDFIMIVIAATLPFLSCSREEKTLKHLIHENKSFLIKETRKKNVISDTTFVQFIKEIKIPYKDNSIQITYPINADCSVCILDFIIFYLTIQKTPEIDHVFVIINENQSPLFEYYLEQNIPEALTDQRMTIIPINLDYPFGMKNNSNIFLSNGEAVFNAFNIINGVFSPLSLF